MVSKKMKQYKRALHIFRRDLRLDDNQALLHALETAEEVIPCFILDPRQVKKHAYRSEPALVFMIESLEDVSRQLQDKGGKLYLFHGKAEEVVQELIKKERIDLITFNRDYTLFAQKRDKQIEQRCKAEGVEVSCHADALLTEPESVHKENGTPYTVFTPFSRKAKIQQVKKPTKNKYTNYSNKKIAKEKEMSILQTLKVKETPKKAIQGGRTEGLKLVKNMKNLTSYESIRDIPSENGTSHLSAHHKFGTVSIREAYHTAVFIFGEEHTFITELYWRDFFTHIAYHFPHVFESAFNKKYNALKWSNDKKKFQVWCEGNTGFPIVDAGMRELNKTGFMHNRVRMITASFLVKDLHIDWRWGEQYFAQKLIDYDPAVNNGNWQWAASTGCDAQPYFRIFNPWRQQERFDPECNYIKKWVPEIKELSEKEIHKLEEQRPITPIKYPLPIVNHKKASTESKAMYAYVAKTSL